MSTPTPDIRNLNPSPKTRFMASNDNVAKHRQLVDSKEFERGVDFALAEYIVRLMQHVGDGNSAAQVGLKLLGVHEFLTTFRLLGEKITMAPAPKVMDHLPEAN